ncbi:MAG TPA: DNA mismatch repair endonuclease MutL [Planctomycetota bacterium]|nr:DNA mismatch repair endonuclease MutL [Planctomycetota bacterium]
MAQIHVLAPDVVNKIAAGEVIERPASAVKELVENALDAGASEIRVDIEEGGRKLLRITDNGQGIAADELPLAFAPHATSKLSTADDLFRVSTFGFRGEALASIGSVARVRILSRPAGAEGAEIVVENGVASPVMPGAAAPGTVVEVRNLFQNVPVRRKFLRSIEVETEHVIESVSRFGIALPGVRFDLFVDGERRYSLSPGDRRSRIAVFFDEDVSRALKEVETADFHAYVAPAQYSRINAKGMSFFLNGRYIRDRVLLRAMNEAYRELVPHGRYPVAFVFLTLASDEVDVNVHPTKIEVRFRSVWKLHDRLVGAIRAKLLEGSLDHRVAPESVAERTTVFGELPVPGRPAREVVDFFTREPELRLAEIPARPLLTTGRRVFQLHNRYLVEEVDDGLRILDQHALHERVMLEELRKQFSGAAIAKQRLLLPAVVTLTREQRARLDDQRELLDSFGLECEDFGRDAVAVRAVPALVAEHDPVTLLTDFLELARDSEADVPLLERALEFMACRAAVKFGRKLADEEIVRLLQDAAQMDFSATCAHGRPTGIKLTLDDLERFFHR